RPNVLFLTQNSGGGAPQQLFERFVGALERLAVFHDLERLLIGERDANEFERHLRRVGVAREFLQPNRVLHSLGKRHTPFVLRLQEQIAQRTGPVAYIVSDRGERAARQFFLALDPGEIVAKERLEAFAPLLHLQGRRNNKDAEARDGFFQYGKLQHFLRFKMREQSAFGKVERLGERAQRKPVKAEPHRLGQRLADNGFAGGFAFSHRQKIARPVFL